MAEPFWFASVASRHSAPAVDAKARGPPEHLRQYADRTLLGESSRTETGTLEEPVETGAYK